MDRMEELILQYVRDEYVEEDDDVEVDIDTPLISSGLIDSFSMVSLKTFIEKEYAIRVPDSMATPESFDTVESICELVRELRG
jgi:acyl carrier protein